MEQSRNISLEIPWSRYMDVSLIGGTPKIIHLIGFSGFLNHPFWGTPIFGNTHMLDYT